MAICYEGKENSRRTALKEADKILMQNVNSNEDKEMRICR